MKKQILTMWIVTRSGELKMMTIKSNHPFIEKGSAIDERVMSIACKDGYSILTLPTVEHISQQSPEMLDMIYEML